MSKLIDIQELRESNSLGGGMYLPHETITALLDAVVAAEELRDAATRVFSELPAPKVQISSSYEDFVESIDAVDVATRPFDFGDDA